FKQVRSDMDIMFVASGAAECNVLNQVFAPKVEANKENAEALSSMIKLFRKAKCQESEVYFQASIYAHKLNPTAETAAGCAYQSVKKKEYSNAIALFEEAISLSDDNSDKYEYSYHIALLHQASGSYTAARSAARRALEFEPNHGEPYILIAQMYADSKVYPDDAILAKTVFWAAVDKLEKAKSVDPECAAKAQQLINTYKKYFPTKEDVFFKPELKPGAPFQIGGWIGESVICRD
ncbi:MAG: tetratricopeptide repeat protein, partial [Paludibacteraceae bacterium]|nr:tetratricopeptide repeat protein [Paludibacteraceae bacterium]